jgi:cell division protein FtsZ
MTTFKLNRTASSPLPHRVCVLGVGGGGCRAIDHVIGGSSCPAVAALNTDSRSLEESRAITKIQLGLADADGFGAGGDPDLGKLAAAHDVEMIRGLFTDTDVAIVVAGLGGGTGTGATPVILDAARVAGVFTIVVTTLPFAFEGERKRSIADAGLRAITDSADLVLKIQNDSLFDTIGEDNLKAAFKSADEILAAAVCALWQLLVQPAFIGVDLADLRALSSRTGGACWFGFGNASGVGRAHDAVGSVLEGSVLDNGKKLREAGAALVCIAGSHDLALSEVSDVMGALSKVIQDDCALTVGTVINELWRDRILVSVFVADHKRSVRSNTRATSTPAKGARRRKQELQDKLKLGAPGKGRFKNVEATIMDGEDLDIPTYQRRGLNIEK